MPSLFALDSTIVVILSGGHSAEEHAKERAETILYDHEAAGDLVGISAPALAECGHCDYEGNFVIWPLNAAAAMLANRLTPPMIEAGRAVGATKRAAKVDALILATAEVVGCTALYTTDEWFESVAKREGLRIEIRPLPPLRPRQGTLISPDDFSG